jgi:hypothetical protein
VSADSEAVVEAVVEAEEAVGVVVVAAGEVAVAAG